MTWLVWSTLWRLPGPARAGPHAIVLRTTPGQGVPTLMTREKSHFIRVGASEWDSLTAELEQTGAV